MMNFSNLNRRLALGALGSIAAMSVPALAQSAAWPDKPIKFILSHPAGSGPDNVGRILGERLAKLWGQAMVLENKPGGQNVIGAQAAAKAAPDGYVIGLGGAGAIIARELTSLFRLRSVEAIHPAPTAPARG